MHAKGYKPARRALLALAATAFLASCQSFQQDMIVESTGVADFAILDRIDDLVATYRAGEVEADLDAAKELARDARGKKSLNSAWNARLAGLWGEIAFLEKDANAVRDAIATLDKTAPAEERRWLLKAWSEPDATKAKELLVEGRAKADTNARIVAELARMEMAAGDYRGALALFDESLPSLSPAWRKAYGKDRDIAFKLKDSGAVSMRAAEYLSDGPMTFLGMIVVVESETTLLDTYTGGNPADAGVLFDTISASKWFGEDVRPEDAVTRKDVAVFLWRLVSEKRKQPELLTKYSKRFATRATPIPDVAVGAWYFDSVLGCIEWSIMSLVDGVTFRPLELVNGFDFYDMARKAAAK